MKHKWKIDVSLEDDPRLCIEDDPKLCKRILSFLDYDIVNDGGIKWHIISRETGDVLFNMFIAMSIADAVSKILGYEWIPNGSARPRCDDEYHLKALKEISYVRNPLYKKSLEEIKIMLDLHGAA